MKKFLMLLALLIPSVMMAQEENKLPDNDDEEITVFAKISGINKNLLGLGNKLSVEIDFGDEKSFWGNDGRNILIDDNGKELKFNSMIDAMNFMGRQGWEYEDSYVITVDQQPVIHWLLSKKIKKGEDKRGSIHQKRDKKKKKKSTPEASKKYDDQSTEADQGIVSPFS